MATEILQHTELILSILANALALILALVTVTSSRGDH